MWHVTDPPLNLSSPLAWQSESWGAPWCQLAERRTGCTAGTPREVASPCVTSCEPSGSLHLQERQEIGFFFCKSSPSYTSMSFSCRGHYMTMKKKKKKKNATAAQLPKASQFHVLEELLKKTSFYPKLYIRISDLFVSDQVRIYISVPSQQLQAHHSDSAKILVWFIHLPDDVSNGSS